MDKFLVEYACHQPDFRIREGFPDINAVVRMVIDEKRFFSRLQQVLYYLGFRLRTSAVKADEPSTMGGIKQEPGIYKVLPPTFQTIRRNVGDEMHRICPECAVEMRWIHQWRDLFEVLAVQEIPPSFLHLLGGQQVLEIPVLRFVIRGHIQLEIILHGLDETGLKIQQHSIDIEETAVTVDRRRGNRFPGIQTSGHVRKMDEEEKGESGVMGTRTAV